MTDDIRAFRYIFPLQFGANNDVEHFIDLTTFAVTNGWKVGDTYEFVIEDNWAVLRKRDTTNNEQP